MIGGPDTWRRLEEFLRVLSRIAEAVERIADTMDPQGAGARRVEERRRLKS